MAKRQRNPRFVTEIGVALFPYLTKPDTEYNPNGVYQTKLKLPAGSILKTAKGESVGTIEDFLAEQQEAAVERAKREKPGKKIKEADLPLEEDDEGNSVVKFKLNAKVEPRNGDPFEQKPALFDAHGKPITPDALWGGSRIKVAFEVIPFNKPGTGVGLSLRMKAVQVIELVAGSGGSGESFGFGEEEGYTAPEGEAQASSPSDEEEAPQWDDEEGGDF